MPGRIVVCVGCRQERIHHAKGKCRPCYHRGQYPYRSTGSGRGGRGVAKSDEAFGSRLEEFAALRRGGLSIRKAAARIGVADRTGDRYAARLKLWEDGSVE